MTVDAVQEDVASVERRRLSRLMAARLALAVGVLAIALHVVGPAEGAETVGWALYGTLAVAFLATVAFAAVLGRVRNLGAFGASQLAIDLLLVTCLLLFSGGGRSIFSFLYVPIVVFGSILFDKRGGYGAALAASIGYGAVLVFAPAVPWGEVPAREPAERFALWGVHSGALLLVALLSSALAREVREAGERLHASRRQLAHAEARYARVVDSLTSGLVTIDHEGRITSANPEAERILGTAADRLVATPLRDVLPGIDALTAREREEGERQRARLTRQVAGRAQQLGVAASVLRGEEGTPTGHVVIFQDVTEVVDLEHRLHRSARLAGVGELAASIAHEIRNPLAAISGSVQMLRGGSSADDRTRLMEIVLREINRLDELISDFLCYARPAEPKRKDVPVAAVFAELAEMRRGDASAPGVVLEASVAEDLEVDADPDQLRQVLWNLVRNAEQAMGDAGTVRLAAALAPQGDVGADRNGPEEGAAFVEIRVSDTGPGIPPEDLERVFDPFYTTRPDGTGLGLPTVHRIVEAHGGRITLERGPEGGTVVAIGLPAAGEGA